MLLAEVGFPLDTPTPTSSAVGDDITEALGLLPTSLQVRTQLPRAHSMSRLWEPLGTGRHLAPCLRKTRSAMWKTGSETGRNLWDERENGFQSPQR